MKSFKKDKSDFIRKSINSCIIFSKQQNSLLVYSTQGSNDEYYLNIIFKKGYFQQKIENKRNIDNDLLFILHLVHNFPINPPKLFCLSSLSHIGIEICDGKDILIDVVSTEWNSKIEAVDIIIKISSFIEKMLQKNSNELFIGKYSLNYEYDYNLLLKVPHQYFNNVEQIINTKNKITEKRFLMLTSLFFLLFSYEVGYLNYSNLRLIFWGSIFSIYGIKRKELILELEFSKNKNQKINLFLKTNEGEKIKNIFLYILKVRGVDYLIEENKKKNKSSNNEINNKADNNNISKESEENEIKNNGEISIEVNNLK